MAPQLTDFSLFEVRLVKKLFRVKSNQNIADMLERPVAEVTELISNITGGDISPFSKKEQQQKKLADKKKEILRQQKQQQESRKENATHKRKLYEPPKRPEKMYETKSMDYSQLVAIHIDDHHHTTIYVKPGEDIDLCRQRYLEQLERKKKIVYAPLGTLRVKKFKPIK